MKNSIARVFVAGDWDADGFVATALIVYAQEKLGVYPLKGRAVVDKKPVDPERIKFIFGDISGSYDLMVFLDLPYTDSVPNILKMLKNHFGIKKIMYIDHHLSTLNNRDKLIDVVDELVVDKSKPTSAIVYDILRRQGVSIHSRLKAFVDLVKYMDSGRRIPSDLMKLFELTKLISKALTIKRDVELWAKIVDWLASPTPLPLPLEEGVLRRVKEIVEERDKEINNIAVDLAVSAMRIGDFRFIDARNKWHYRGASALASKLASILKAPVIVWVGTSKEYTLLVIKAFGGKAYRIAKYLVGEGIAKDIAGHPNLAIVKIPKNISREELIEQLHRAVFYT